MIIKLNLMFSDGIETLELNAPENLSETELAIWAEGAIAGVMAYINQGVPHNED